MSTYDDIINILYGITDRRRLKITGEGAYVLTGKLSGSVCVDSGKATILSSSIAGTYSPKMQDGKIASAWLDFSTLI